VRPPALLEVSLGLTLVHWGSRLVAGAVVAACAGVILAAVTDARHHTFGFELLLFAVAVLASCAVGIGTLAGFNGRVGCLETPPELPVACVRIRLAVVLEGCGWLSGVVNLGIAWATAVGSITVPWEVIHAVFGLFFVLFLAGRVFFFAYLRALARCVDYARSAGSPLPAIMVVVTAATMVATSVGLLLTSNGHSSLTADRMAAMGGTFLGTLAVLAGLYLYGRMLHRLRRAVAEHNTRSTGSE
jgi:hypothetical protein